MLKTADLVLDNSSVWTRGSGNKSHEKVHSNGFMALVTTPSRSDRRIAIRQTWLSTLPKYPGLAMRFFTGGKELEADIKSALLKEKEKFGDLELLPVKNGFFIAMGVVLDFWALRFPVLSKDWRRLLHLPQLNLNNLTCSFVSKRNYVTAWTKDFW